TAPTVESLIHVPVAEKELLTLKEPDGRRFKLEDSLVSSAIEGFRRAFVTFAVGGCIQRINGIVAGKAAKKLRYSLLLQSEAARESHAWQESIVDSLTTKFAAEGAANSQLFGDLVKQAYDDLKQSIALYGQPLPPLDDVRNAVRDAFARDYLT